MSVGDEHTMITESQRDKFRVPDIGQELSGLNFRFRRLQDQLGLGSGVTDLQVVEDGSQCGQGTVVTRCRRAVQAHSLTVDCE